MAKLSRLAGSTGHILTLFVEDSTKTDGSGLTGLTNASGGLTCAYKRNTGSSMSVVTLDTIATLGTYGTYSAGHGGFKEIDAVNGPGGYEFQPPNAAYASGAQSVAFWLFGATNMAVCKVEIELTAVNNQSATAFITGVNSLAPPTNWNAHAIDSSGRGQIQSGTGTGQLSLSSGVVAADVTKLNGVAASAANLERSASTMYRGSVTGASPTTTTLVDTGLTQSAADFWKGRIVIFTSGTNAGQATNITGYTPGGSPTLTFTALTAAPAQSDTYVIV